MPYHALQPFVYLDQLRTEIKEYIYYKYIICYYYYYHYYYYFYVYTYM